MLFCRLLYHDFGASFAFCFVNLSVHGSRLCALSFGVGKDVRFAEFYIFQKFKRFIKILDALAWESRYYIRGYCRVFICRAELFNRFGILRACVFSVHCLKRFVASALQRYVKMVAYLWHFCYPADKFVRQKPRFNRA